MSAGNSPSLPVDAASQQVPGSNINTSSGPSMSATAGVNPTPHLTPAPVTTAPQPREPATPALRMQRPRATGRPQPANHLRKTDFELDVLKEVCRRCLGPRNGDAWQACQNACFHCKKNEHRGAACPNARDFFFNGDGKVVPAAECRSLKWSQHDTVASGFPPTLENVERAKKDRTQPDRHWPEAAKRRVLGTDYTAPSKRPANDAPAHRKPKTVRANPNFSGSGRQLSQPPQPDLQWPGRPLNPIPMPPPEWQSSGMGPSGYGQQIQDWRQQYQPPQQQQLQRQALQPSMVTMMVETYHRFQEVRESQPPMTFNNVRRRFQEFEEFSAFLHESMPHGQANDFNILGAASQWPQETPYPLHEQTTFQSPQQTPYLTREQTPSRPPRQTPSGGWDMESWRCQALAARIDMTGIDRILSDRDKRKGEGESEESEESEAPQEKKKRRRKNRSRRQRKKNPKTEPEYPNPPVIPPVASNAPPPTPADAPVASNAPPPTPADAPVAPNSNAPPHAPPSGAGGDSYDQFTLAPKANTETSVMEKTVGQQAAESDRTEWVTV
ncbi:hypothetical protein NA57DRAFT_81247 [Rhizodiscina lignyota]|uniref:Uncharacterized protein n=1 Tax=Rhizodiscina lignyota TaxID=1504668 RepID=A0A9P4I6G9_9PEZI|nr:hypothetical protein NA57DRAFT_81247 [Rhizodiscina lignyota]